MLTWNREPAARRVHAPGVGEFLFDPQIARGGDHTDIGFALLMGGKADEGELPPLKQTHEFANFVTTLAGRGLSGSV